MTHDALELQLSAHARCVRRLATALLDDAAAADDVTQEVLVRAWRQPPRESGSLRAFLLQITRNLARRWRRATLRREQRERSRARPDLEPGVGDRVERSEMLRGIAAEVAALPSLLREVVLLRHYDDLPPRRIAERLGVGVEAVESRLKRAHEQLAARLRVRFGRDGLFPALLTFVVPATPAGPLVGTLAMSLESKSVIAAAAAVLLLLGVWSFAFDSADDGAAPTSIAGANAAARDPASTSDEGDRSARESLATASGPPPAAGANDVPPAAAEPWLVQLRGRVVDERRLPVVGAAVAAQTTGGERSDGMTGDDGRFALSLRTASVHRCLGEVAAFVGESCGVGQFVATTDRTDCDVGAIAIESAGALRVTVCRAGVPERGAAVVVRRAQWSAGMRWSGATGDDGAVVLERVAPGRSCIAVAGADGTFAAVAADVVARQRRDVVIDLRDRIPVRVDVSSRADETPIAGARIRAWLHLSLEGGMSARVALHELLSLPSSDMHGTAVLIGFARDDRVEVDAEHPDWQAMQSPAPVDLPAREPRIALRLDGIESRAYRLVAGEVAVPADGTMFVVGASPRTPIARVPLRDGVLRLDRVRAIEGEVFAWGPDCVAHLPWSAAGAGQPVDATLRRPRRLVVELRDPAGAPLGGWPIELKAGQPIPIGQTDDTGRVVVDGLAVTDGASNVVVASVPSLMPHELGSVDLEHGDGTITAVVGAARNVHAHVFVDERPQLPGTLNLCSPDGHVTDIREDAERGLVTCRYWPLHADQRAELRLYGSWRQSMGVAVLPPGNGPADVEFKLMNYGAGVVDLVPAADGKCQILVERAFGTAPGQVAVWTHVQPGQVGAAPRFTNLRPGRFRLRDGLSDVTGPWVDVMADAPDARLSLDLSGVVEVRGRVVGTADELRGVVVEVQDGTGRVVRSAPAAADGAFGLRFAADRADLVLVAVRAGLTSSPAPVTGPMTDVQILAPR